jgi:hypothetical protein
MTKVIILSDIHNNTASLRKIDGILTESDYVIFLGDGISALYPYKNLLGDRLIMVKGNCDIFSQLSEEVVTEIDGFKIFITHGHKYHVKEYLDDLMQKAKETDADIVLYGHTHVAYTDYIDGRTVINPGSLGNPRMGNPTYAYMILSGKKPLVKIVEVR